MVKCDNDCGRSGLDPEMGFSTGDVDGTFHFCSKKCQSEWEDNKYVNCVEDVA